MQKDTKIGESDKALFYDGQCGICKTFVTKASQRLNPHADLKFIPY